MATKRIGKTQRPYFQKARDSALLAVEVYNKPAVKFKSEGYIALMIMAWTALMHAVFLRKGRKPYYRGADRQFVTVDGDVKHWELGECLRRFWGSDTGNPVRKNVEFFIPLRNKIEHRHIPQLDGAIFGECQALLLNFDALLGHQFGAKHQLRESLSFSLQMFPSGESFAQAVKGNKSLAEIKRFIEDYRATLSADALASSQYAFKAFLIQVANHDSADALPIQFIQYDKLSAEQREELERFSVMIKLKSATILNTGLLRPGAVVKAVQKALGNPKVPRRGGQGDRFTQDTHQRCWRAYGVRPAGDSELPGATNEKYCIYDEPHKDYLYTPAWVALLTEKMSNEEGYEALYVKN